MRTRRLLFSGLLGLLTAFGYGPVFGGFPGSLPFLGAVLAVNVAAVLSVLFLSPRLPPFAVALLGAFAVAGTAFLGSRPGAGIVNGPALLLTGSLPVEPTGPVLAAVALVAGWATLTAALCAAYAGPLLLPVLPPLVSLLAALSLGGPLTTIPGWYAPLIVAVVAVMLLSCRQDGRASAAGERSVLTPARLAVAVVSVGAALLAALLGPALPRSGAPADIRAAVAAPVDPCGSVSPMQRYPAFLFGEKPVKLEVDSSHPGERLRLAVLTHFNGVYWSVDADYRRAGRRLPDPPPQARAVRVTQRVRVLAGREHLDWLVAAGRPVQADPGGLGVDDETGNVVPFCADPPESYSATSVAGQWIPLEDLVSASPAPASSAPEPPLPESVRGFVERRTRGQDGLGGKLNALHRAFTAEGVFFYDKTRNAPGGHGHHQIENLLVHNRGTSEQYSSAFAVMARHLGADARVVVGFAPPEGGGSPYVVRGRDIDAWVEVRFTGVGWVSIDPSPRKNPIDRALKSRPVSSAPPVAPVDPADEAMTGPEASSAPDAPGGGPRDTDAARGLGPWALTPLPVLVLLLPFLARTLRRWRRRRAASPREAVLGAWRETLDVLAEAGLPIDPAHTTGDVVRLLSGIRRAQRLAFLVDAAACAPEPPHAASASEAWEISAELTGRVREGLPLGRRVGAFLDPRPLLRSGGAALGREVRRVRRR